MKIIIFGCGNIYHNRKCEIPDDVEILGIIDNNQHLHGKKIDGIDVFNPSEVQHYNYDYIVLMSNAAIEMRTQLLQIGYRQNKLIHYLDFFGLFSYEMKAYDGIKEDKKTNGKTLLIVSVPLLFNGVPIVSLTTAKTAIQMGYSVTIAAEDGDRRYIKEATRNGIKILICKELKTASLENLSWTDNYDYILVTSLPMIRLAIKLSKKRKINVWIHESSNEYKNMNFWREEIEEGIKNETIKIYAPSKRARNHFLEYYTSKTEVRMFPLGIEDKQHNHIVKMQFSYGLVGPFISIKGHDIFLSATEALPKNILEATNFFLIGKREVSQYGESILKRASLINNCILLGERTQQEMCRVYQMLNVVVVASREETVSMVAIEAMMMGKVCIVSDQTGIAEYIEQGKNGFVFPNENVEKLQELMCWCYQHQEQLGEIGRNARITYERNFSIEVFADNFQKIWD